MMDCLVLSQPLSSPQKRAFQEDDARDHPRPTLEVHYSHFAGPASPHSMGSPQAPKPADLPNGASRQPSPALSVGSTLTTMTATPSPANLDGSAESHPASGPPAKRRKLTPSEKAEREAQKQAKEADKRARDEEKRQKNEMKEAERQAKDEEKRRMNEIKEEKKREKELEKQRKEEEKAKKESSQARIVSFFAKPQTPNHSNRPSSSTPAVSSTYPIARPKSQTPQPQLSAYERTFLPFSLPSNSTCSPISRFTHDDQALARLRSTYAKLLDQPKDRALASCTVQGVLCPSPWELAPRGSQLVVKNLMLQWEGTANNPMNITKTSSPDPAKLLRSIPTKIIFFDQDVRPPYIGTFTKSTSKREAQLLARNPWRRVRSDTDYEYDSELEWEEAEDGEDLESEGESDTESVETEDMGGFLDDEDEANGPLARQKIMAMDMDPICSGLCWEDDKGQSDGRQRPDFKHLRIAVLLDSCVLPIDPNSIAYWTSEDKSSSSDPAIAPSGAMAPPRLPLESRPASTVNGTIATLLGNGTVKTKSTSAKVPSRLLDGNELEEFKRAVRGSEHNKQGLLAILKKEKFPNITLAVLKDTLSAVAIRHGKSEAEKRWIIVDTA